jgi:hypothetical protein
MTARRFPPPWTIEDIGAAFVVTDSARQKAGDDPLSVTPVTSPMQITM